MSDQTIDQTPQAASWASADSQRRVRRRYAADRRLQAYGIIAIALAVGLLAILVSSLVITGFPAFVQTKVDLTVFIDPAKVDASKPTDGNYRAVVRDALASFLPADATDKQKTDVAKILSADAPYIVRDYVVKHPDTIGKTITLPIAVSDPFDQLHKGVIPKEVDALSWSQVVYFERLQNRGVVVEEGGRTSLKLDVYVDPAKIEAGPPPTGDFAALARDSLQAYLPDVHDTALFGMLADDAPEAIAKLVTADPNLIGKTAQVVFPVSPPFAALAKGETPKVLNPRFNPTQIEAYDAMIAKGVVHSPFNWELFFNADSRFPERAGLAGAITGSFYALLVCLLLSFPIGIAAAVYLEEFAPEEPAHRPDRSEHQQSRRRAFGGVRPAGLGRVPRLFRPAALGPAGRRHGAVADDAADHHHRHPRRAQSGAAIDPRGGAWRRRVEAPGDDASRAAAGDARHSDRYHHRHGAGAGRDRAPAADRHECVHSKHREHGHSRAGDFAADANL